MATTITGTESADRLSVYSYSDRFVNALGGNDEITIGDGSYQVSRQKNVTVAAGNGNDTVYNGVGGPGVSPCFAYDKISVSGGAGNDLIFNGYAYKYNSVSGTSDFYNENYEGNYSTLEGGSGNDTIWNKGYSNTIEGGADDDYFENYGGNILFKYTLGDGNDCIKGFGSSDTLQIGDGTGTYSSQTSGSDVIVYVGEGSITLLSAASLSEVNIDGIETELPAWRINGTTATYGTSTNAQITINGVKSLDGISLSGTTVTIAASSLNQIGVTISNGYSLVLGNNVTNPNYTTASWSLNGNTAIYTGASNTAGYLLENNQINYISANSGDSFTVSGVKSTSGLSVSGKVVTVGNSALNQSAVTISNNNYTLALGNDVTKSTTTTAGWTLNGSIATYKTAAVSAGYQLANNQISYVEASGGESVTVSGVKSLDGLSISGKVITVAANALNQSNVTISDGYTLALQGVATPNYTAAHFDGLTYKSASNTAGYTLSDNKIVYTAAQAETDLFTISGVTNTNGITIDDKTVTVPNSALNQNTTVTISNGYTLKLADNVTTPQPTAAHWEHSGNVATYKNNFTSAGYSIVNNQIVYKVASGGETLTAVSGVNSKEGLTLSGSIVTVSAASLNQNTVTISNGYTLALGNDVSIPQPTTAHWEHSGKVATYKNDSASAGYHLENNQIVYKAASGGEDLITVNGVKSAEGLKLDGSTVRVAATALNQENVTISDGYTLALENTVPTPQPTAAGWTYSGNVAIYKNNSISAGYELENNQIVYKAASGGETLTTVSGVKSTNGLKMEGSTVTVSAAALNQNKVTISNGYTLALADDVQKSTTTAAGWILNGNIATYKNAETSAGYQLVNNQIFYNAASGGAALVTVNGVKSTNGINLEGSTVTVSNSVLNKGTVTVSKGYSLTLDDDVPISTTTAAGWTLNGNIATYKNESTTAGYKLLGGNQIVYNTASVGKTLVKIKGVKSTDGLSLNEKVVTVKASALNKAKVTVSNGYTLALANDVTKSTTAKAGWNLSGSTATYKSASKTAGYTLAGNGKSISYVKATKATAATIKGAKSKSGIKVSGNKITLKNSALKNKVTVSGGFEFNFAANYKNATITGSKNADAITTNGNNLSIAGGKGNDSIKVLGNTTTVTGGAGKDVFVCNAGNNVIADYAAEDKISIAGSAKISTSGKDVVFTVGKNKLTVKGGKDRKITYTDNTGENIYDSGVKTNDKSIKLLENYLKNDFNVASYGDEIRTIDASAVVHDISITANKLANKIIGSDQNDTLTGGGSNDTLTGGKGSDVFVYNSGDGNDVITDYTAEDRIQIASGKVDTINKSNKDIIFTVGDGTITVKGAADKVVTYLDASGKKNYYPAPKNSVITNGTTVTVLEEYKSDTFDVGNVKNGNKVKMIDATSVSRNLKIVGNAQANIILGGKGNDTIYAGAGNDTLQGDEGKNVFVYQSGNDVINDYTADDKISLASGAVSSSSVKGLDAVLKVGKGKITLTNGADKVITVADKKGNNYIIGNDKANELKGGSGNDTLVGGKGNDSLWGDAGNDTFIYNSGDGKDTIMDYQSGDLLQIMGGTFSKSAYSKGTLTLTVGKGSITMKNVDTSTAFNINGTSYKISGNKLK